MEELEDYNNVTFLQNEINISRIDPPDTSKEDLEALKMSFNDIKGVKTEL